MQQCIKLNATNRSKAYPEKAGYVVDRKIKKDKVFVFGFEGIPQQNKDIFLDSSMVEHSAVNRVVAGSSPARGV